MQKKKADGSQIRNINRANILDLIRNQVSISRTRIADCLGISLSTVLRIVDDLIEEGLVIPIEKKERGGGRPGELLSFNGQAYAMIGIDLGYPNMLGTVADLSGEIHFQYSIPIERFDGQENIGRLFTLIDKLLSVPELAGKTLKGIGIGVPGLVDNDMNLIRHSNNLGWDNLALSDMLNERYHLPVLLDTDINLIVLGEAGFGLGHQAKSLVCLTIGTRILSGIILDGELVCGSSHSAGLLGYSLPGIDFLGKDFDEIGALDSVASGNYVTQKAREILTANQGLSNFENLDSISIYQAAEREEPWALPIIEKVVDYLAVTIANIAVFLDPEIIIISGKLSSAAGFLPEMILTRLRGRIPKLPNIKISNLGTRSTVMGAIMMIYKGVLHQ